MMITMMIIWIAGIHDVKVTSRFTMPLFMMFFGQLLITSTLDAWHTIPDHNQLSVHASLKTILQHSFLFLSFSLALKVSVLPSKYRSKKIKPTILQIAILIRMHISKQCIYRQFLIRSHDNLSLVIPNNKMLEHWWLKVLFIVMLWWI